MYSYLSHLPARRPKQKLGVRQVEKRDWPQHRKFVRGCMCLVRDCHSDKIECAHVRHGLQDGEQGGVGLKPHDMWAVPLCHDHHAEAHRIGHKSFERKYRLDLRGSAIGLAKRSPCVAIRDKVRSIQT